MIYINNKQSQIKLLTRNSRILDYLHRTKFSKTITIIYICQVAKLLFLPNSVVF